MSELKKAVLELIRFSDDDDWTEELGAALKALRNALESEAGWTDVVPGWSAGNYEYRLNRRPLVDYSRDQALHAHEGDSDICSRCGEHRSWHDDA